MVDSLGPYYKQKEIKWMFNPTLAVFFGGVCEAGVKWIKRLLRVVCREDALTSEELATWFIKMKAILSSRLLCPLSDGPFDFGVLTPGHFLNVFPLLSVPEPSLIHVQENRLSIPGSCLFCNSWTYLISDLSSGEN